MKLATLTTPKGIAVYPHLNEPDTKFDSQKQKGGEWHTDLRIPEAEGLPLVNQLEAFLKEWIVTRNAEQKENKKKPFKPFNTPWELEEDDEGNPTGFYLFKFKRGVEWTDRDGNLRTNKIEFMDSQGQGQKEMTETIGAGSTLCINFQVRGWASPLGISCALDLLKVQIIDLHIYEGDASSNPFEVHEEGHTFDSDPDTEEEAVEETASTSPTDGDF